MKFYQKEILFKLSNRLLGEAIRTEHDIGEACSWFDKSRLAAKAAALRDQQQTLLEIIQ